MEIIALNGRLTLPKTPQADLARLVLPSCGVFLGAVRTVERTYRA